MMEVLELVGGLGCVFLAFAVFVSWFVESDWGGEE